jgi:hypothetical protein
MVMPINGVIGITRDRNVDAVQRTASLSTADTAQCIYSMDMHLGWKNIGVNIHINALKFS